MKLITTIKPRRDGTVIVTGADGKALHTFALNDEGQLACDVPDDGTIGMLLLTENFYPADEADYGRALELTGGNAALGGAEGASDDDSGADDDEGTPDSAPVEAGTQAVAVTPAALRRARRAS